MKTTIRALLALLAVLALAVGLAACGGGSDEGTGGDQATSDGTNEGAANEGPGAGKSTVEVIEANPANKGKKITVGSKNFDEQYILGEIYAQSLEAAGFDVEKQLNLGSEQIAFRALKRGDIDAYPEYTGTALTSFYRVKIDEAPRDKDEAFSLLQKELKADQITALPQTGFENSYRLTSTKETAEKYGNPKTITEVAEAAGSDASLSGFPECRQRTDCLLGLNNVYDWDPKFISSQGQYADLDSGQADFTMGFSTDGALSTGKYVTYEDDKGLYPPYFVTLLTSNEGMEAMGQNGVEIIERVQEPLTEEVMQELNSRVTLDKQEPEQVAKDYLSESGFVEASS
ncbi:MAG: ABC transporter, substrate-binding protein (cluster 13, osmolytes) / ABC transporter, permease protein (cluster 13, osmolytes) [uncultured Solirubrobacteraceae bacterium]|uniref:ABC transporter, substrate-binding protein (Cluster 13, osmolytes) / ABC transporter, permease protein (Cluster 13, osmolytes) n=1 Tax=uncultured Solirubrobacteraceae bacterium TaxID=1162706 RepID=A0A6J4RGU3_9ACTN|nr:MAG: ABC transporter, substrate-binding protein (cluster 13, osmolytes) / ABC transporter, permease protein (cluster 13, osmolytes) [uncultured Solirubrobacteraceae bacterium]